MKKLVKKEIEKLIKEEKLNCSIKEFKDKVSWGRISARQKLSLDFIREFKDKVHWHNIERFQKITKKDIEEYKKQEKQKIEKELEKTRVKNRFQLIRF